MKCANRAIRSDAAPYRIPRMPLPRMPLLDMVRRPRYFERQLDTLSRVVEG
jgi:hypothetical protein